MPRSYGARGLRDTVGVSRSNTVHDLVAAIEDATQSSVGVNEYEPLLVDLPTLLQSDGSHRALGVAELTRLATEWPWGAVEILEFFLRTLQWTEVKDVLESQRESNPDSQRRVLAGQALEVYAAECPSGDIYETSRSDDS